MSSLFHYERFVKRLPASSMDLQHDEPWRGRIDGSMFVDE